MNRIVHLTDLHFGCERRDLVRPLHDALRQTQPELVVVTGDLAHRARARQFRQAMAFLHGLRLPFITLPGNHDIPLFNLFARFLLPFRGWRRHVCAELTPLAAFGRIRIFSANTADPYQWRRGILRKNDIQRLTTLLRDGPETAINILACHHPFIEPPGFDRGETLGATAALPVLAQAGLQVILSGHLHHWAVGLGITPTTPQPVLVLQSGTALCGRPDEQHHGFSVLDLSLGYITITPWIIDEAAAVFNPSASHRFVRVDGNWQPLPLTPTLAHSIPLN